MPSTEERTAMLQAEGSPQGQAVTSQLGFASWRTVLLVLGGFGGLAGVGAYFGSRGATKADTGKADTPKLTPGRQTPGRKADTGPWTFVINGKGSNDCPSGAWPLTLSECKVAATHYGKDFMRAQNASNHPVGCYVFSRWVYFNTHTSGKARDSEAPVCAAACPVPSASFALPAKSCPDNCINGNKSYASFPSAFEACPKVSGCAFILKWTDGKFYLRRSTDPDMNEHQNRGMSYACGEGGVSFDTLGWQNNDGKSCEDYSKYGWCQNGDFASGREWSGSAGCGLLCARRSLGGCSFRLTATNTNCAMVYNYPADNCIVCGKGNTQGHNSGADSGANGGTNASSNIGSNSGADSGANAGTNNSSNIGTKKVGD